MTDEQFAMLQDVLRLRGRDIKLMFEAQARNHQVLMTSLSALSGQARLQGEIPPQVLLQQPMIFRDALDRVTPVHLEFIDSLEVSVSAFRCYSNVSTRLTKYFCLKAFIAVLKVRFKDIGLKKLERNEFLLMDDKCKRDLDLRNPWCTVMKPGQYVSMSIGFNTQGQRNICPGCSSEKEAGYSTETVW
jgi:hypothetical protein